MRAIPYVVIVQSSAFDARCSRIVVPLARKDSVPVEPGLLASRLNPVFVIQGLEVALHALQSFRSSRHKATRSSLTSMKSFPAPSAEHFAIHS